MSTSAEKAKKIIELFSSLKPFEQLLSEMRVDTEDINDNDVIPLPLNWSKEAQMKRLGFIESKTEKTLPYLAGGSSCNGTNL